MPLRLFWGRKAPCHIIGNKALQGKVYARATQGLRRTAKYVSGWNDNRKGNSRHNGSFVPVMYVEKALAPI